MPRAPGSRSKRMRQQSKTQRRRRQDLRPSASERGYDRQWAELREWYARRYPLCEHCLEAGLTVPVHEVDHIIPFDGPGDALRLDPANLQSLCRPCHAKKTAKQANKAARCLTPPSPDPT